MTRDATTAEGDAVTARGPQRRHDTDDVERAIAAFDRSDPVLTPAERETTVRFAADEDRATVFTAQPGVGRRLLAHPRARVEWVTLVDGGRRPRVDLSAVERGDTVGAVRVTLPVAALSVSSTPRDDGTPAAVVSERVYDTVEVEP